MHQDPASTATAVLAHVGGPANVLSVTHCMTRLRLSLADADAVDDAGLRAVPGVLGVVTDGGACQIVLGPGVVEAVTAQVAARTAPRPAPARGRAGPRAALRRVADVFVPLIPALIGCGVLAGLNGVLLNTGLLPGLTPALSTVAGAFMALIAVLVGYQTAREFGGTPVLGAAVAAVVVHPGVAKVTAFGVHLVPGQGGVLGALAAAFLATRVERWCRGRVPDALDVLLTPTVTVLVPGLVTLYGLMYAAGAVSAAIGTAANWLLGTTGALAGLLLGGLFLPLVMLGLHQALIPIHATLIAQQGYTALLPLLSMAGAGQVGAALAVYVRLRHDVSLRTTIRSALPAGLLGVGEPLIYGVSLPLGRPFLTACAGGAAGGAFIGCFAMLGTRVGATAIGPSGWALFPLLAGNRGPGPTAAVYAGGLFTGYAVGFLATYLFGLPAATRRSGGLPHKGVPPEEPPPQPGSGQQPTGLSGNL
ncbi:PTS system IIB component, Glc family /PTS system IIC component, Glc family [Streptomyces misionensis]|uniref:PTS system IIB component, Glc family /PTS system IIC component, Glc family n=1 Tax=Streptomyces misionensis TaxID=67331 RepID=A0A1H4XQ60_9ACTN|nr:PTS transporter subunit EIIC [Streptomyces misionensis]SED07011.1 PTS system IIB component, Glc family /PTS system IIC component, Glc family [Streptomyces misionensis]